jgi:hypothetical protein
MTLSISEKGELNMEMNLDLDPILPSSQTEIIPEFIDSQGHPAARSTTGGWTSALFIIGTNLESLLNSIYIYSCTKKFCLVYIYFSEKSI